MKKTKKPPDEVKKRKSWHHDIKKIDGEWVEDVVAAFQQEQDPYKKELILLKINDNYAIFRNKWANDFAKHLNNDLEAGRQLHDEIIWKAASKFNFEKAKKEKGKAFNAFLVASQCNNLRNLNNTKTSKKNHPRVTCPICGEEVYQIDAKHLRHETTIEIYSNLFPKYPLVCYNGSVKTKEGLIKMDNAFVAKIEGKKYYTVKDFWNEHASLRPEFPIECPMSGQLLYSVDANYPSLLSKGYTEEEFVQDFPDFKGIIVCPFTGKKKLEITQAYLDIVLNQAPDLSKNKNHDIKVRQVKVINPYTGKLVDEITLQMLVEAGTDLRTHVFKYATIELDKTYPEPFICPITGRKTVIVSTSKLEKFGLSSWDFHMATCKYPLRKYHVRSAFDGKWVDNIWSHLEKKTYNYAVPYTTDDFEREYSNVCTKAFVSTNCYFESDSGDQMHISDLFVTTKNENDVLEIEDSLMSAAQDDLDKAIVQSIKKSHTVEDLYFHSSMTREIDLDLKDQSTKELKSEIKKLVGLTDFDITSSVMAEEEVKKSVTIMIPSRDTIRKRLQRMIQASDID